MLGKGLFVDLLHLNHDIFDRFSHQVHEGTTSRLARMIHERFCCHRGFAALSRETTFVRKWSCWFLVSGFMLSGNTLRKLETRNFEPETFHEERDFATNRHESCGLARHVSQRLDDRLREEKPS